MPELPEVQTIVNYLSKKVVGLKITDAWADPAKPVNTGSGASWPKLKKELKNKKILSVRRRAKYIIMDIEGKKTLFVHQKLSGHLLYGKWSRFIPRHKVEVDKSRILDFVTPTKSETKSGKLKNPTWVSDLPGPLREDRNNGYIRFVIMLNNGYQLALSDLRRFGKVILVDDDKVKDLKEISGLGPEPLEINFNQFEKLFEKKKGRIKQVLMDPTFIAGIGNIYADEILWSSGIHPLSRVENLNTKDLKSVYNHTVRILKKAIKYKGSSMDDYRLPSGEKGRFQDVLNAYQLTGKTCKKKDGGIIERIKLGGRSAHFCPKHQILK